MWSLVPVPAGVLLLGTLVVHEVALDEALQGLSQAERDLIAEKQKLEDRIKPMCEWVTGHTLKAEAKVTPLLMAMASKCNVVLHGLDFRVKSGLSMTRKIVAQLHEANKTHNDDDAIEAAVWCEQRQALRYTLVCENSSYADDVKNAFDTLKGVGFASEFVWNYWKDTEPYNVIRSRMWSDELQAWCFVVFHTRESLEMSEARLAHYQRSIGMVFHTATFHDDHTLARAVEALQSDEVWIAKVLSMHIPDGVEGIGKLIQSGAASNALAMPSNKQASHEVHAELAGERAEAIVAAFGTALAQVLMDAEAAEEAGYIVKAVGLYEETAAMLRAAIKKANGKSSAKLKRGASVELEACKAKCTKLNLQLEHRSLIITAITDLLAIVKMQHRWLRNHPRARS